MRLLLVAGGLVVAFVAPSRADPQSAYPVPDVDRPQLYLPGMTSLDLGLDFPTYRTTTLDASGNQVESTTSLGHDRNLDVVVTHRFGPVQVAGRMLGSPSGIYFYATVATYLGPVPGVLELDADIEAPNPGSTLDHNYGQSAAYLYKHVAVPRLLALAAVGRVSASEWAFTPAMRMTTHAHQVLGEVGTEAEIQLLPELAVAVGGGIDVPISRSQNITTPTQFYAGTQLQYTIGHWDLYGDLQLEDLTRSRLPYAGVGAVHRWGG